MNSSSHEWMPTILNLLEASREGLSVTSARMNELAILAPYLALIKLVATLSTIYLIKRKRNT